MLLTTQECSCLSSLLRLLVREPSVLGDEARYQRVVDFLVQATCVENMTREITEQEFVAFACKGMCYEQHENPCLLALTIQLVAHWSITRGRKFFQRLLEQYPNIVSSTVNHINHKSAVVRMACIHAWSELISTADWAQNWLATSPMAAQLVAYSLEDSSTNVMVAGCQFLTKVITGTTNPTLSIIRKQILNELGLVDALSSYLYDEGEDGDAQALVALELLWVLTQTKNNEAYQFLLNSQLLFQYKQLLTHSSKMVRAKFLDVIELGLDWWPEAHSVFGMNICRITSLNKISKQDFLFYDEILEGLSEDNNTIEWLDAARLAMLVCNYYQSMEGSEDLCRCFYILLWCYSTNNTPTINQQLNHSVFKGSEPYKTWILDIIRKLPYRHVDSTYWIMAQHSAMICRQWIIKFTIPSCEISEALDHFTTMASAAFNANQLQTTTIIARSITAHINKLNVNNNYCLLANRFLENLLNTDQMDDRTILNALNCTCQLYTCPSLLLPKTIPKTIQSICKLTMHKRVDIREISLRTLRNILNGIVERQLTITDTTIAANIRYILEQTLRNVVCDVEAVVALNSIDIIKMYISTYYEQLDEPLLCIKDLLNPLLKHHDASVRRVALLTAIFLSQHNQGKHQDHSSIISTIINQDLVEQLSYDDDWEVRLVSCRVFEQLWHESIQSTSSIDIPTFYAYSIDRYLLRSTNDNVLAVRKEAVRILHDINQWINDKHLDVKEDTHNNNDQSTKRQRQTRDNYDDHYLYTLKYRLDTVNWTQLSENTSSNVSDVSQLLEELGLVTTTNNNNNNDDDQWMPAAPLVDDCF